MFEPRGLGADVRRVKDPIIEMLEQLHGQADAIEAIRIPMEYPRQN